MKLNLNLTYFLFALVSVLLFVGCATDEKTGSGAEKRSVVDEEIALADAPTLIEYESVVLANKVREELCLPCDVPNMQEYPPKQSQEPVVAATNVLCTCLNSIYQISIDYKDHTPEYVQKMDADFVELLKLSLKEYENAHN